METTVLSLPGQTYEDRRWTGDLSAYRIHADGKPYHTFRTATVLAEGDGTVFRRCVFENTAGPGETAGQGIALYLDGDRILLEDCVIRGHQDTLFLAPLPPAPLLTDGFLGPKQFAPRTPRTFLFRNCLIEGGVDFVFGGATAVFDRCEFRSVEPGYVFAPSTPPDVAAGFIARDCAFTRAPGVPDGSCFLGRPWRDHGRVRLVNCRMDAHIAPAGWDDWGKAGARATVCFEEYGSRGPGTAGRRPDWVTVG